jgi:hypothetical protein
MHKNTNINSALKQKCALHLHPILSTSHAERSFFNKNNQSKNKVTNKYIKDRVSKFGRVYCVMTKTQFDEVMKKSINYVYSLKPIVENESEVVEVKFTKPFGGIYTEYVKLVESVN